ncbi:MAG TPA: hypothetical protein VFH45_00530 [Acidimicrobiales bacterium]|nr:hypothetical protein [Acidimicrobiales bacterium]
MEVSLSPDVARERWESFPDRTAAVRAALEWRVSRSGWTTAALAERSGEAWEVTGSDRVTGAGEVPRGFRPIALAAADGQVDAMVLALGEAVAGAADEDVALVGRLLATLVSGAAPRSRRRSDGAVLGRASFLEVVEAEDRRCDAESVVATVIVVDLPRAKPRGGTRVTTEAGMRLAASARGSDVLGRLGPSRLAMLAPGLEEENSQAVIERLRASLGPVGGIARFTCCTRDEDHSLIDGLAGLLEASNRVEDRFLPCGECGRRGAYVAPGFGVLRCKYCRASVNLDGVAPEADGVSA